MSEKMNLLFTVMDGAAGRPNPSLHGKTALEAAETPNLDKLSENSNIGTMTVVPGVAPESDSAVISLLGYDPKKVYTGRGPLEALGAGMKFENGDLALRCNFATLKENELIDRRVGRTLTRKEAEELEEVINSEVKLEEAEFNFKSTLGHRGALVIKSKHEMSPEITNTDPAYGKKGLISFAKEEYESKINRCTPLEKEAFKTAEIVNEFTEKVIEVLKGAEVNKKRIKEGKMPANAILTRDAGTEKPKLEDINKRFRLNWTILANMPLEIGIAKAAGMKIKKINQEDDYDEWVQKTTEAMEENECLYIHLKGPDLPGHDGDAERKKRTIEEIDREYYEKLLRKIDLSKTVIAVTCDHATPCTIKAHSDDPVPIMISSPQLRKNNKRFNEKQAKKGEVEISSGNKLMPYLIDLYKSIKK